MSFLLFGKKLLSVFDTTQEIKQGEYPPLNRIERVWYAPVDGEYADDRGNKKKLKAGEVGHRKIRYV